jgi:hypothetical protein
MDRQIARPASKVIFAVILAVAAAVYIWGGAPSQTTADDRLTRCGATPNEVAYAFDIPAASRMWDYLPRFGISPELSEDSEPAFVVIFKGDVRLPIGGVPGAGGIQTVSDVVCVIKSDGRRSSILISLAKGCAFPQ